MIQPVGVTDHRVGHAAQISSRYQSTLLRASRRPPAEPAGIRARLTRLDQGWLERFLEHRIADERVLRLIQKWLRAGVIEEGEWSETEEGTAQGASVSPLLANVYLHYVFDLWADQWRRRNARGDVVLTRFADDFLAGFEHHAGR